ncbi:MAG: serine/threonine protein kinase, partial [Candidatus Riflebacteria bacterium]|nr:serine/threonine protein kinase [Candidatus Riflebacteria bacterium]
MDIDRELLTSLSTRYRMEGIIGSGAMGIVMRAIDQTLERPVAIKVMDPRGVSSEHNARFVREAQVLASLSHHRVLRVFDFGTVGSFAYLVMELLSGVSLAARLEQGALDDKETLSVLKASLEGLAYVHARGVLHRDLKPSNIWLRDQKDVVLIDFGLARQVVVDGETVLTATGAVIGTPSYLPPECLRGEAASARGDLFSLSMSALRVWTGVDVHSLDPGSRGASIPQVLSSLATGSYHGTAERLIGGRGNLGRVILRGLRHDPGERYATADAMLAALDPTSGAAQRLSVRSRARPATVSLASAPSAGPGASAALPPARKRLAAMVIGLIVLIAATGGVVSVTRAPRAPAPAPTTASHGRSTAPTAGPVAGAVDPGRPTALTPVLGLRVRPLEQSCYVYFWSSRPIRVEATCLDERSRVAAGAVAETAPATTHRVIVGGLRPGTDYRLVLASGQPDRWVRVSPVRFRTLAARTREVFLKPIGTWESLLDKTDRQLVRPLRLVGDEADLPAILSELQRRQDESFWSEALHAMSAIASPESVPTIRRGIELFDRPGKAEEKLLEQAIGTLETIGGEGASDALADLCRSALASRPWKAWAMWIRARAARALTLVDPDRAATLYGQLVKQKEHRSTAIFGAGALALPWFEPELQRAAREQLPVTHNPLLHVALGAAVRFGGRASLGLVEDSLRRGGLSA